MSPFYRKGKNKAQEGLSPRSPAMAGGHPSRWAQVTPTTTPCQNHLSTGLRLVGGPSRCGSMEGPYLGLLGQRLRRDGTWWMPMWCVVSWAAAALPAPAPRLRPGPSPILLDNVECRGQEAA